MSDDLILVSPEQALDARVASPEDTAIAAWLRSKAGISGSEKTQAAYSETIEDFRAALALGGADLFASNLRTIYECAEHFLGTGKTGRALAPNTRRQRRGILSSFYTFCLRRGIYDANPILMIETPKGEAEHAAHAFDSADVSDRLARIDTRSLAGERDYLLLHLALATTRRSGEIARLTWGDIRLEGGQTVAHWLCKGAKRKKDALTPAMVAALADYRERLASALAERHIAITESTPVFPSFANSNYGKKMATASLGQIALHHLGVSKFHALRHTGARALEKQGVHVSKIQEQLGHGSLKITTDYLKEIREISTEHGDILQRAFGFTGPHNEDRR